MQEAVLLTPEQRAIVAEPSRIMLIEAVAGAGKTTTLAQLVAHRLRQGTSPGKILVLVFSDAAAAVFNHRLAEAGVAASLAKTVHIATYARFGHQALAGWAERGLIDTLPPLAATPETLRAWVWQAIESAAASGRPDPDYGYDLTNLHAEIVLDELARLKGTLDLHRLEDESDADIAESLDLPPGLVAICRQYERLRCPDAGQFAFQGEGDLLFDALTLRQRNPQTLHFPAYDLVVADEWHDANAAHLALLRDLVGPATLLAAMGDQEQVIHAWHGADPRFMGEYFTQAFPAARLMPLTASFRCGATLGAAAVHLNGKPFTSHRLRDTAIDEIAYSAGTPHACAQQVATTLQSLTKSSGEFAPSDCAIILRDHHQSIALENALTEHGISYALDGLPSYFRRLEVLMLRGILHILTGTIADVSDPAEIRGVVRALGTFAGLRYSAKDWAEAERYIIEQPDLIRVFYEGRLTQVHEEQETPDDASRRWRKHFANVCGRLAGHAGDWSAGQLLRTAATELKLDDAARRLFVHRHQADAVVRSINGFIAFAEQSAWGVTDFLARLDAAQQQSLSFRKRRQRVTLTTARQAKGKEWPCVLMPWLEHGEFPQTGADAAEERRLFYVAITRAKDRLVLFVPGDGGTVHPSQFIAALRLDEARREGAAHTLANQDLIGPDAPEKPPERLYLDVPYAEKDDVKRLGAQWDSVQRKWWIPGTTQRSRFARWLVKKPV